MSIDSDGRFPRDVRLANLAKDRTVEELAVDLDQMMTVALGLGEQLAEIGEMVGLDHDAEDLAVTARVRALVTDPRVRQAIDEFGVRRGRNADVAKGDG